MCSFDVKFLFQGQQEKISIESSTSLDELLEKICGRFEALDDANLIVLAETTGIINNMQIEHDNFDVVKAVLAESDHEASFLVNLKLMPVANDDMDTKSDGSPSPSPLPVPYSQRVQPPPMVSQPFAPLNYANNSNDQKHSNYNKTIVLKQHQQKQDPSVCFSAL